MNCDFRRMLPEEESAVMGLFNSRFGYLEEITLFLKEKIGTVFVAVSDDSVVGMTIALPCEIDQLKGFYLYGVATRNDRERQGIASGLLRYIENESKQSGMDFCCLHPSNESNFILYQRLGYQLKSRLKCNTMQVDNSMVLSNVHSCDADLYYQWTHSIKKQSLVWDDSMIAFQEKWLRLYGGGFYRVDDIGFAAVTIEENKAVIREVYSSVEHFNHVIHSVGYYLNLQDVIVHVSSIDGEVGLQVKSFQKEISDYLTADLLFD